jgi:hypothetical protein
MSTSQPMTLAPDGKPFTSEKDAAAYIKKKELDVELNQAFKHQGGWCIFDLSVLPNGMKQVLEAQSNAEAEPAKKSGTPKMKYFKVTFQAKTNPNDENDVPLSLNGTTILSKRDVEVILPASYLEVADHTVRSQYEQKPGHDRKIVSVIKKFVYHKGKEVTKEDFEAFKKSGNAIRDKELEAREHAAG